MGAIRITIPHTPHTLYILPAHIPFFTTLVHHPFLAMAQLTRQNRRISQGDQTYKKYLYVHQGEVYGYFQIMEFPTARKDGKALYVDLSDPGPEQIKLFASSERGEMDGIFQHARHSNPNNIFHLTPRFENDTVAVWKMTFTSGINAYFVDESVVGRVLVDNSSTDDSAEGPSDDLRVSNLRVLGF